MYIHIYVSVLPSAHWQSDLQRSVSQRATDSMHNDLRPDYPAWGYCDIQRRQPVAPPTGLVGAGRKWNSGMATAETMACGKRTKATPTALSGACCDLDSPSLPPPRPGKPHKPITNLITCAQLYPPCQTWTQTRSSGRPCSLLLVCLVQHVPRCVAVSPCRRQREQRNRLSWELSV